MALAKLAGRVPCVEINLPVFAEVIGLHVPPAAPAGKCNSNGWFPYTQLKSRRVRKWAELWRLRAAASDFFEATNGYLLCQKYVEKQVQKNMYFGTSWGTPGGKGHAKRRQNGGLGVY